MYIRLDDGFYPVTEQGIREAALPNILPGIIQEDHLADLGFAIVQPTAPPPFEWIGVKEGMPVEEDGVYHQTWVIDAGGMTFDEHKERAISILNGIFEAQAENLAGHYPLFEKQTWTMQRDEAHAYSSWLENGSDPTLRPTTPTLDTLCQYRDETIDTFHQKVLQNDANWVIAARHLSGARQKFERELRAASTLVGLVEQLDVAKQFSLPAL